jgi:hypothetical protein
VSKFSWGPNEKLVRADTKVEPRTVDDLLKDLGVAQASRSEQRDAVVRWLEDHEPSRWMSVTLRHEGFPFTARRPQPQRLRVTHATPFSRPDRLAIHIFDGGGVRIVRGWSGGNWQFPDVREFTGSPTTIARFTGATSGAEAEAELTSA